jgi:cyclophilin family peptidyl-prolyl cis-trans isomerase
MRIACATVLAVVSFGLVTSGVSAGQPKPLPASPVLVLETVKGTIEIQLFRSEAPKSVLHIGTLVRQDFYRGLRFHRVTNALVQIGDPQSRRMNLENVWGTSNSGTPINAAEISKTGRHVRGSVGLAHGGAPQYADSQFYIMKVDGPSLDGKYAIVGQVTTGMAVVDKIVKADILKVAYLKGEGPK